MGVTTACSLDIVVPAMNLVGCMIDFVLMPRFGRRPLILTALSILAVMLLLIGIFRSMSPNKPTLNGIGACCVIINLVYLASVGPLTYTLASEVPATRLRA